MKCGAFRSDINQSNCSLFQLPIEVDPIVSTLLQEEVVLFTVLVRNS